MGACLEAVRSLPSTFCWPELSHIVTPTARESGKCRFVMPSEDKSHVFNDTLPRLPCCLVSFA